MVVVPRSMAIPRGPESDRGKEDSSAPMLYKVTSAHSCRKGKETILLLSIFV
jgi:hypothetical protein